MIDDYKKHKTLPEIIGNFLHNPSPDLISDLEKNIRIHKAAKHEIVVTQGEICDRFLLVGSGFMRIMYKSPEAEDTLLFGSAGEVFASMQSYYFNRPSALGVEAIVESEYWTLSFRHFRELAVRYPELYEWLSNVLSEQLAILEKRYVFANVKSAEERLLNFVEKNIIFYNRHDKLKYLSKIVPLKYIAQYLGMTPQTLSRLRKELLTRERP